MTGSFRPGFHSTAETSSSAPARALKIAVGCKYGQASWKKQKLIDDCHVVSLVLSVRIMDAHGPGRTVTNYAFGCPGLTPDGYQHRRFHFYLILIL